jgi:hypothetical protein
MKHASSGVHRDCLILILFFVTSRIILIVCGIRFDASPLGWFFQYLDPHYLESRLFESLLYLHSQPPAFNFFLGAVLSVAKDAAPMVFHSLYLLTGLFMTLILYSILLKLSIPQYFALGCVMFFAVSPPVILYEHWLFYTYPVAAFILFSLWVLHKYLDTLRWWSGLLFFSISALVVMTRTLFHAIWFLGLVIGITALAKHARVKTILCAILPFLCIVGLYVKNYAIFKQLTLSTWFGMNIYKMTFSVPLSEIEHMVEEEKISDIALIMPFQSPDSYDEYTNFNTHTGIPVLDTQYKSTGYINFNHIGYIAVSQQYMSTAFTLIKRYPQHYAFSVLKAFYAFLRPSCDSIIFRNENRDKLGPWLDLYEQGLCGDCLKQIWQAKFTNRYNETRTIHLNLLYLFIPVLCAWGLYCLLVGRTRLSLRLPAYGIICYTMYMVLYVALAGNLIETSENMRFRFLVIPLFYVIIATLFKHFFNKSKQT